MFAVDPVLLAVRESGVVDPAFETVAVGYRFAKWNQDTIVSHRDTRVVLALPLAGLLVKLATVVERFVAVSAHHLAVDLASFLVVGLPLIRIDGVDVVIVVVVDVTTT